MHQSNLKLKSKEFKIFLNSLSNISDTSILEVKTDEIYSIAASDDRSMFLWSSLEGDFDIETKLNLHHRIYLFRCVQCEAVGLFSFSEKFE